MSSIKTTYEIENERFCVVYETFTGEVRVHDKEDCQSIVFIGPMKELTQIHHLAHELHHKHLEEQQ